MNITIRKAQAQDLDAVAGIYANIHTVEEQGLLGVLNDLHKGRDTGSKWKWLIDVSALFLVVVAVTGLGIQRPMPSGSGRIKPLANRSRMKGSALWDRALKGPVQLMTRSKSWRTI